MSIAPLPDREHGLELLRQMLLVRRFEEKCVELYSATKIRGFLHLYIGEEAVAVGVLQALAPEDAVVATYREHGHALVRGVSVRLDHGGDVWQGRGVLARARRIDAPVRRRDPLLRWQRDRGRWSAARPRSCARRQVRRAASA